MTRQRFASAAGLAVAILSIACPTQAQNLLTNGGFEEGTLAGWDAAGATDDIGVGEAIGHDSNWAAYAGPDPVGSLAQTLATMPGMDYVVSFWLRLDDSAQPNSFAWSWNGAMQGLPFSDVGRFDYTRFSATVTATAAASSLRFDFVNPQSFWLVDDVSVTAVPEPATAALLVAGLFATGLLVPSLRRRRTANVDAL